MKPQTDHTVNCPACGVIQVRYYRSSTGEVVHRSTCSRRGKTSMEWHYAARVLGGEHARVLAEIESIPWLRACSYCMSTRPGSTAGGEPS